ncbi:MAG: ATP:cob(I)alamin adenosyltransferase [Chloroflexi bacterium RBG_13_53_26]|nr:MAG: ATP:cob(I)alamin adenosyltransferase [Chloroflexi bacterium RBG_13_53_26]
MKTFNRKGDRGETSLLYNTRVPKSDPHCEAYGTIDEAVATLGLARVLSRKERVQHVLLRAQKDLFILASELAAPMEEYGRFAGEYPVITAQKVQELEDGIDELEREVEMPREFIIPGDSTGSAAIHMARAIVRRAERRVVNLEQNGQLPNGELLKYLNRLADLLFVLACYEDKGSRL